MKKLSLADQLFLICILLIFVIIISLGIILPNTLRPIYEENIYNYLKQPLFFVQDDIESNIVSNTEIAYIYVSSNKFVRFSDNLMDIINISSIEEIMDKFESDFGHFKYKKKTYYYYMVHEGNVFKISLTNDKYINYVQRKIWSVILIVVGFTFGIVSLSLICWSNFLVKRIKKLKRKIDNLNNDDYDHEIDSQYKDELYTLDVAIYNVRSYLREQDEYKNQMYQNISHDFKTPITVIKSYIEACEDGVESYDKTLQVTKEQIKKLEIKVHSLLYLNKLNYIRDCKEIIDMNYDVSKVLNISIEKFKNARPDVKLSVFIDTNNTIFRGSFSMWEAIIDNLLNNFMRYAKSEIKIWIKNKKIILYNDGENIDDKIINNIFTPYEKGVNGMFGLGLSIVRKTLDYLDYDISIDNEKVGVRFVIKDRR